MNRLKVLLLTLATIGTTSSPAGIVTAAVTAAVVTSAMAPTASSQRSQPVEAAPPVGGRAQLVCEGRTQSPAYQCKFAGSFTVPRGVSGCVVSPELRAQVSPGHLIQFQGGTLCTMHPEFISFGLFALLSGFSKYWSDSVRSQPSDGYNVVFHYFHAGN
jgi:hypothetical protein